MKKNDHLWSSFIQSQINLEPKNRICRANVWTQKDFWVLLSYGILPLCHIFFSYSMLFRHILITVSNSIIFFLRSTWIFCLLETVFLFREKNRLPNLFCAWKKGSFWNEILAKLLGWAIFVLRFPIPLFFLFR